jgi:hypothetical protein
MQVHIYVENMIFKIQKASAPLCSMLEFDIIWREKGA